MDLNTHYLALKNKNNMKYPYTKNILTDLLEKEEKDLLFWKKIVSDNKDEASVRQANGNIPNTECRINELKKVLELLSTKS